MKRVWNPEVWFFLFFTGLLVFNWPFLAIAYKKASDLTDSLARTFSLKYNSRYRKDY
ncbi:MAG: hypothetical protein ACK4TF_07845 [Thermodesulfovibrionales bacterium]